MSDGPNITALETPDWLNKGDNAWQLTAATLVGLQSIPGLVLIYAGTSECYRSARQSLSVACRHHEGLHLSALRPRRVVDLRYSENGRLTAPSWPSTLSLPRCVPLVKEAGRN